MSDGELSHEMSDGELSYAMSDRELSHDMRDGELSLVQTWFTLRDAGPGLTHAVSHLRRRVT